VARPWLRRPQLARQGPPAGRLVPSVPGAQPLSSRARARAEPRSATVLRLGQARWQGSRLRAPGLTREVSESHGNSQDRVTQAEYPDFKFALRVGWVRSPGDRRPGPDSG
jgi:hypothetical protein